MAKRFIKSQVRLMKNLMDRLKEEGFKLSFNDPFFCWIHNEPIKEAEGEFRDKLEFFIVDPPVPRVSPFDLVTCKISLERSSLYFELSIYYCSPLENKSEPQEFEDVYDSHKEWHSSVGSHLQKIVRKYGLDWDTEYDECITDCLWGRFNQGEDDLIIEFLLELREIDNEFKKRRSLFMEFVSPIISNFSDHIYRRRLEYEIQNVINFGEGE